jgi:kexin
MSTFRYIFLIVPFTLLLVFSGCSGGGGGGVAVILPTTTTSSFIDSPVENLHFKCLSGVTDTTDEGGNYTCPVGDSVTFVLGLNTLGPIDMKDGIVTPYDVFPTNIRAAVNLARLLQTLDNNTSDDVIYLDDTLVAKLTSALDFTLDADSFETSVKNLLGLSISVVSDTVARDNMDKAIIDSGVTPPTRGNHVPEATTTVLETLEDTILRGSLGALDIDGDATFTFSKVVDALHGSLTINNDGSFVYAPDANYSGSDTFSYKVNDGTVDSAVSNVTITVRSVNDAPVITSASVVSVAENQLSALRVIANDVDGDSLSYSLGGVDANAFNIDTNGVVTFKVAPDYETKNVYNFSVTVSDGSLSVTQDITLNISDVVEGSVGVLDSDDDYIPDDIENLLGMDPNNADEDADGVLDGLQSSGTHGDKFFDKEWHIISLGTTVNDSGVATIVGNDLAIKELYHKYMGYNNGNNIIVQVVDTGVDADHEDLVANMDMSRSLNGDKQGDPSALTDTEVNTHGTMVAGIMAARAFNEKGVRGIIPFAKIAGSNWMDNQTYEGLEAAWLSGDGANEIAVSNNSWGSYYDPNTLYEQIMQKGVADLRDKKGRVYVMSAGNEREEYGNANLQYSASNRYPIIVASIKHDNTYASYSSPGSNILVSGYGGEYYQLAPTIASTTIMGTSKNSGDINEKTTWSNDTNQNYTFAMNGTSAAAPVVSASIALVLEACPDLTWRDIKYLVAKNATQIDTSNTSWVQNGAGLWHSIDYGFGLINPKAMIDECSVGYTNLPAEKTQSVSKTFNTLIPDDENTYSFSLDLKDSSITIEWVEVTIDNDSSYASDYKIDLVSPSGTKTNIVFANKVSQDYSKAWMDGGFRFGSAAMIGESSQGTWRVDITDMSSGDSGTLKSIDLKVYGH